MTRLHSARQHAAVVVVGVLVLSMSVWPTRPARATDDDPFERLRIADIDVSQPPDTTLLVSAPPTAQTGTLSDDQVEVFEAGEPRAAVVTRESLDSLDLGLVLDTSLGSDGLRAVQAAAVEFVLQLMPGASLRLFGADGTAIEAGAAQSAPGSAIAAIRTLEPSETDNLNQAVSRATAALSDSPRRRPVLVVLGADLGRRLQALEHPGLLYLVSIGEAAVPPELMPGGQAVSVPSAGDALGPVDQIANALRNQYRVTYRSRMPESPGVEVTVAVAGRGEATASVESGGDPPAVVSVAGARPQPAARGDGLPAGDGAPAWAWLSAWWPWTVALALIAVSVLAIAVLARRRESVPLLTGVRVRPPQRTGVPRDGPPLPGTPRRPARLLDAETRTQLGHAHSALRELARATRVVNGTIPPALFRLQEAQANARLEGHRCELDVVLERSLRKESHDECTALVWRSATAIETGWEHTAQQERPPPAVVEISSRAVQPMAPGQARGDPVRALNPLIDIGLEHLEAASRPLEAAGLIARAVTVTHVMRAGRLRTPVLALSPFLADRADAYHEAIDAPADNDDHRERWLRLFFKAITHQADDALAKLDVLGGLRKRYRAATDDPHARRLIDLLLAEPFVNVGLVAARLEISTRAARALTTRAQRELGWLARAAGKPPLWVAEEILRVFVPVPNVATAERGKSMVRR